MKTQITINNLLQNRISPFDTGEIRLTKLFSYFLYDSPTLETAMRETAVDNTADGDISREQLLQQRWDSFIAELGENPHEIYEGQKQNFPKLCEGDGLGNNSVLSRRFKGFVCKRKNSKEPDYACVFRHLRNAIAHMNVFMVNAGNRKYILFEDYSKEKNLTGRLLFTQSDLEKLKKIMGR